MFCLKKKKNITQLYSLYIWYLYQTIRCSGVTYYLFLTNCIFFFFLINETKYAYYQIPPFPVPSINLDLFRNRSKKKKKHLIRTKKMVCIVNIAFKYILQKPFSTGLLYNTLFFYLSVKEYDNIFHENFNFLHYKLSSFE